MSTPTVVEIVAALEPTTRDDFADEPPERRRPFSVVAPAVVPTEQVPVDR